MPSMNAGSVAALVLAGGLLGCAPSGSMPFGLGDSRAGFDNRGSERRVAMMAEDACRDEIRDRGWDLVSIGASETSGVNDVDVAMRIEQADGDTHDVTCTYDEGRKRVRIDQ